MGMCSGAYMAFHSAAQLGNPIVVESVLINPLTFYWKEGMPNRIPATRVKGLLPAALVAADQPGSMDAEAPAKTAEEEKQERQQAYKKRLDLEIRPRRVTGIKGAIVLSQDGKDARIRKKCIRCGTEDNKRTLLRIMPGTARASFFCPKCRRVSPIQMTGT